jgi:ketosteroid isomerase-like protein
MSNTPEDEVVLFANEAFYTAFSSGDVDAMDKLWAHEHPCACLHPGAPPLMDREESMMSWQHILADTGVTSIEMHSAKVIASGDVALVVCIEALAGGALVATNGFILEDGQWRMILHQAGPCPDALGPNEDEDGEPKVH